MTVPMWYCIDKVMWLRPAKDMQVGTGYHTIRAVQVHRCMGVDRCTADNEQAKTDGEKFQRGHLIEQPRPLLPASMRVSEV